MHESGHMNHTHTSGPRRKFKTNDPQLTVEGQLKPGEHTDLIIFTIPLAFFEIVCIVNIPPEGETAAPVYCKFKINKFPNPFAPAERPRRSDRPAEEGPGYSVSDE